MPLFLPGPGPYPNPSTEALVQTSGTVDATVVVGTGGATAEGTAANAQASSTLAVGTGSATAQGTAVDTKASSTVAVGAGTATASGTAADAKASSTVVVGTGSATAAGTAVTPVVSVDATVKVGRIDDFARANGAVGAGAGAAIWDTVLGGAGAADLQIDSGRAAATSTEQSAVTDESFPADVEFEVTLGLDQGGEFMRLGFCLQQHTTSAWDGYLVTVVHPTGQTIVTRVDNGAFTTLDDFTEGWSDGDKLGVRRSGSGITVHRYSGGAWTQISSVTDGTYGAGRAALVIGNGGTGTLRLDDFRSGGATVASGTAADPKASSTVVVGTGTATAEGTAATPNAGGNTTIAVGTGSADAAGTAVTARASSTVAVGTGSATAAGTAVSPQASATVTVGTGSATASGTAVAPKASSTVVVGTGSATASGTAATPTVPGTGGTVIGKDTPTSGNTSFLSAGQAGAFPFVAPGNAQVDRLWLHPNDPDGHNLGVTAVKLGVYAHDAVNNRPGALLASANATGNFTDNSPISADLAVPLSITSGTTYWLALMPFGANLGWEGAVSETFVFTDVGFSDFPDPWAHLGGAEGAPTIWGEQLNVTTVVVGTGSAVASGTSATPVVDEPEEEGEPGGGGIIDWTSPYDQRSRTVKVGTGRARASGTRAIPRVVNGPQPLRVKLPPLRRPVSARVTVGTGGARASGTAVVSRVAPFVGTGVALASGTPARPRRMIPVEDAERMVDEAVASVLLMSGS